MITPRKALFAVALVLLGCALLNVRWTRWLSRPVTRAVDTVQWPAGWVAANFKTDPPTEGPNYTQGEVREQLLAAQNYNLALWSENQELRDQLEAYKAISIITDIEAIRPVQAQVGFFNDERTNPTMKLLRGSLQGVKKEDPVVYKQNLIGFISDVGPVTSTARLVTSPDYRSEVMIMPPDRVKAGDGWPFVTRVQSDGKGGFYCDLKIKVADQLRVDDVVRVRDPLRKSANGFVLGVIKSFQTHPTDPTQYKRVVITPNTPIGPQSKVIIITDRVD